MEAVIFDIDGTLADVRHRLHFVTNGRRDWDSFFAALPDDGVNAPVRRLLHMVHDNDSRILLVSGRPEKWREATEQWMARHDIAFHALYMRPDNDTRPDYVVKEQILDGILADGYEVLFTVDGRPSVVKMWRRRGLTCLQVDDWDGEERAGKLGQLTLMVGPTGAGKSTWLASAEARRLGIHSSHVVSSDQIRADLCGDFREQSRNDEVFAALHAVVATRIRRGLPAVVDATNLHRRDRMACLDQVIGCPVRYIVLNRPVAEKLATAGWRAEVPGLIEKHEERFRSVIKDVLKGDHLPGVEVVDLREAAYVS